MKSTVGRKSFGRESPDRSSVSGGKPNRCVIFPANAVMVAEALERRNRDWFARTKVETDLIVEIGDSSFHLHKLPMVSRSGYINRLVFEGRKNGDSWNRMNIQIDNFPGGTEIFELVVKFCYGWKIDAEACNIALLYSAAHFLEMSDDLEKGNLINKAESFLSFVLFSSWKDTFQILKSCESMSSLAKELKISQRCTEAIAWKSCLNPKAFDFRDDDDTAGYLNLCANDNKDNSKVKEVGEKWWFEDVSALRIDHFIEVIESLKRKNVKPELVGSCIAHWTAKWFLRITSGLENLTSKHLTQQLQKVTTESLIRILPDEENSVSSNFLLHLLKLGLTLRINSELLSKLERRMASLLEHCCVADLLVKNYGEKDSLYDVGIFIRVVEYYASFVLRNPAPRSLSVGRLVDGYLTIVSRDENLSVQKFQSLAEALPKSARYCDDNLYRAIDMYFKAHPNLTEEERTNVSRPMEYHKLSQEARQHAMKNDRLPVKTITQFVLLEQVNMTRSMTDDGIDYRRTKTEAIIIVNEESEEGCVEHYGQIKMMQKEVEAMKIQLDKLQMCKIEIQRHAKRCLV